MPGSTRKLPVLVAHFGFAHCHVLYSEWRFTGEIVISSCRRAGRNGASSGVGNAYPYRLFQTLAFAFCQRAAAAFTV